LIKNKFNGATLSGASSIDDGVTGSDTSNGTGAFLDQTNNNFFAWSNGNTIMSLVVNVPVGSIVVIMCCGEMGNGGQSAKVRNTTTSTDLGNISLIGNLNFITLSSIQVVDTSPSVGNNTYILQATAGGNTFRVHLKAVVIDLTDTHAGVSKKVNDVIR
jgi:hypothetical protein